MENDKLIDVFEMLCERLGNIEKSVSNVEEHLKESQRVQIGKIDTNLFGWKINVRRVADFERHFEEGWRAECPGSRLIRAAYVSYPDDLWLPAWYDKEITKDALSDSMRGYLQCLDQVKIDYLVKLERELAVKMESNAECESIMCSEIGIKSRYTYVHEFVVQQVLLNLQDDRVSNIQNESAGFWVWMSAGLTIDALMEVIQKAFERLGICLDATKTTCVYPIHPTLATVASFVDSNLGVCSNCDVAIRHAVQKMIPCGLWSWLEYVDQHEITKEMGDDLKDLIRRFGTQSHT